MQDNKKSKKNSKSGGSTARGQAFAKNLISKISPSEETARIRLQKTVSGVGYAILSWMLSSGMFLFGSQPFALALLCATENNLFPVAIGILVAALSGRVGMPLLWGTITVLTFRIIVSFAPGFHEKDRDGVKAISLNLDGLYDGDTPLMIEGEVGQKKGVYNGVFLTTKKVLEDIFCIHGGIDSKKDELEHKHRKYDECISVRVLFSGIGGFVCGLFSLIHNEFSFYSMLGALSFILLTPVIMLIFSGADSSRVLLGGWRHSLSWLAVLVATVWSAGGASMLGIPLPPLVVVLFSLFITSTRGVFSGALSALIFGFIYFPLYAPLVFICVIIYGFISPLKKSIALGSLSVVIVLWCYYFGGAVGLVGVLTPMLIAVPLFFIADRYYPIIYPERAPDAERTNKIFEQGRRAGAGVYFAEAISQQQKSENMSDKLGALSEAFSSLSETFNDLIDRFRRPDILGLKKISDDSLSLVCSDCRNRDVCWGAEYSQTLDAVNKMTSCLHTRGCVTLSDLPEKFVARCNRAQRIVSEATRQCERATEELIEDRRIGLFASNFDDIGAILRDALQNEGEEYECDLTASEKIFDLLVEAGYKIKGVVVCGKRNKRVLIKGGTSQSTAALSGGELCRKLSEAVGVTLMGPIFEMSADETVMTFYAKPILSAICSHGRLAAEGEGEPFAEALKDDEIRFFTDQSCGDSTRVFVNKSSYFYSLISDGMGSGADAALASEVSAMFVEKMLMAGNRADITVRMLNNFLRSENIGLGRECSATLDLFELDLMSGTASFIKSGAAPTFICRDQTVYRVNSRTMPVGIIKQADAKLTRFEIKPWDIVVMVSDGCCPDSEDCPWLSDCLSKTKSPIGETSIEALEEFTESLKDKLLSLAVQNSPADRHRDDICVSVTLIYS